MNVKSIYPLMFLLLLTACYGSRRQQMLTVLDEADSLNRNYIPFATDSQLLAATRFFDAHGTSLEQLRAHYLLGCAYRDLGQAPEALQAWHDAIDRADTTSRDSVPNALLSRVYGQAGELFEQQVLYKNAIQEYLLAQQHALEAKDSLTACLAYGQLVGCYYGLSEKDSALIVGQLTYNRLCELGYVDIAVSFLDVPIVVLLNKQQYEEAGRLVEIYGSHLKKTDMGEYADIRHNMFYYYKGKLLEHGGMSDSAAFYYRRLVDVGRTDNNIGFGYSGLYSIYKTLHNCDSLVKYADSYISHLDTMVNNIKDSKLHVIQGLYDYSHHQAVAKKAHADSQRLRLWITIGSALFLLTVFIVLLVHTYVYFTNKQKLLHLSNQNALTMMEYAHMKSLLKEKENSKTEYQNMYDSVKTEYELAKQVLASMQADGKNPDGWDIEDSLLLSPTVRKFHKKASTGVCINELDWIELRKTVHDYMPGFMNTINSLHYQLNRRETDICILVRLRFIPSEICVLMDVSKNNLSNIRKRLLLRLFDKEGSSKDFDERILNIPR